MSAPTTRYVYRWDVGTQIFNQRRYHGFSGDDPNGPVTSGVVVTNAPTAGTAGWRDRDRTDTYHALCERE